MTLYPSLIETLSNDNTNNQSIFTSFDNIKSQKKTGIKLTGLKIPITSPKNHEGYSYVAKVKVWADISFHKDAVGEKDRWEYYYFQHALSELWEREDPELAARLYFGSAGGKRKTNPKLLETIKKSSKSIEIEILWYGIVEEASTKEQYFTTLHNWPKTGADSNDCWNKNNASGGHHNLNKEMLLSKIQYELLSLKLLTEYDDKGDYDFPEEIEKSEHLKQFIKNIKLPEAFVKKQYLEEFIRNEQFIQSRVKKEGNEEYISMYEQALKDPHTVWKGKVLLYLPEGAKPEDIDNPEVRSKIIGGDGNESSRAVIRVGDRLGLDGIFVLYEDHKHICKTDKERIGNERNRFGVIRDDYVDLEDAIRSLKNVIISYNLFTRLDKNTMIGGTAKIDHSEVKNTLDKLNLSFAEKKTIKREVKNYFDAKCEEKRKTLENNFDFSYNARKIKRDDTGRELPNINRKYWLIAVKEIQQEINDERKEKGDEPIEFIDDPKDPKCNVYAFSSDMYGHKEIGETIYDFQKGLAPDFKTIPIPQDILFLVWFKYDAQEEKFCKTDKHKENKEFLETKMFSAVCKNIMIRPVPLKKRNGND